MWVLYGRVFDVRLCTAVTRAAAWTHRSRQEHVLPRADPRNRRSMDQPVRARAHGRTRPSQTHPWSGARGRARQEAVLHVCSRASATDGSWSFRRWRPPCRAGSGSAPHRRGRS